MDPTTAQFFVVQAHLLRCHAEIVSGAYRFRKTQQMDSASPSGWRDFTDAEKLESAIQEMKRHAGILYDIQQYLESEATKKEEPSSEPKEDSDDEL